MIDGINNKGRKLPQRRLSFILVAESKIEEYIKIIYKEVASKTTLTQRPLKDFWSSYANYLKTTQNLDHSRSQNEYWDCKKNFSEFVKKQGHNKKVGWKEFQPPLPSTVSFLQTMARNLVEEKLGLHSCGHFVLLIGQLALNITFITRQSINSINPSSNLVSATGLGHLIEFAILLVHFILAFVHLLAFILSHSVLNKGIAFLNLAVVLQSTANFSLFKFIHYMNPSTFITEFHDPPFIDTLTDFVKFTLNKPEWEQTYRITHKILYSLLARPLLILLGLIALYVKLLQVTSSLIWLQSLNFTNHVINDLFQNPSHVLSFLGLANNIAGLYGLDPADNRTMFFDHVRIHEYDFLHALLSGFMGDKRQYWIGYWNVLLYSIAIENRDLTEVFWEAVYGEPADYYEEDRKKGVTEVQFTNSPVSSTPVITGSPTEIIPNNQGKRKTITKGSWTSAEAKNQNCNMNNNSRRRRRNLFLRFFDYRGNNYNNKRKRGVNEVV
ncbi:8876_t:CDS:1 [Ambispora leptoticha]|uniref:8876_t:CDS:1 n=1 Tax=Ambispora leptoticha TaxID=144679 RepID=A0A9N9CCV0_9GLOM|nr:8876_t:CDS:1 [Ambispora leptoticha]